MIWLSKVDDQQTLYALARMHASPEFEKLDEILRLAAANIDTRLKNEADQVKLHRAQGAGQFLDELRVLLATARKVGASVGTLQQVASINNNNFS